MFQKDTACTSWNAADICTNCVYTAPAPIESVFWQTGRRSLPPGLLCSSQKRGTSSQILARRHTQTNKRTPVIWICDLCHKPINKQQTSIRCNHTHWVHLKSTQIKQRQYKPDWRCTIRTRTQMVTATPSRNKSPPTHPQTTINQRSKTSSYFKST